MKSLFVNIKKWFKRFETNHQMSEAFINCIFLAMSGGFQDAYTYFTRDGVFANAQTGNVVLMSREFMTGNFKQALKYLFPILAFAAGVFFADRIQKHFKYAKMFHWRQGILLLEIAILLLVGFMPQKMNTLAAVMVSFSCALQVQTFRKVKGYSYASTMCIGNLRSGISSLSDYIQNKDPEEFNRTVYYFGIIFFFAIGAGFGGVLSDNFGIHIICTSCILLLISFILMFKEKIS